MIISLDFLRYKFTRLRIFKNHRQKLSNSSKMLSMPSSQSVWSFVSPGWVFRPLFKAIVIFSISSSIFFSLLISVRIRFLSLILSAFFCPGSLILNTSFLILGIFRSFVYSTHTNALSIVPISCMGHGLVLSTKWTIYLIRLDPSPNLPNIILFFRRIPPTFNIFSPIFLR